MCRVRLLTAFAGLLTSTACAPVYWLGAKMFYNAAPSPPTVQLDVPYDPAAPDDPKRQLDLYLPAGRDFPIVVFVHGGGWATAPSASAAPTSTATSAGSWRARASVRP
jgi:acetyl esterase/lipase